MSLIIDFINLSILKKLLCFSPISHIRGTSVMSGCRIPVFYSEFSAKYLKTLEICQLQARESFISTSKFSQEGLCSGCQRRAQGGKDRVEQGAGMNDFKPLGELRADPVPMKSFSIVSLHKMFGSKPAVRLGCFCARLLLRGQCMTAALHIQNKELQKFFSSSVKVSLITIIVTFYNKTVENLVFRQVCFSCTREGKLLPFVS